MNIPRFFIDSKFIDNVSSTILCQDAKLSKQIRRVLRLENGAKIDFLDGEGNIYHCTLENTDSEISRHILKAKIESHESVTKAIETQITIALPLIKPSRFEWALEKLTELGVTNIVPVALERSVIKITNENSTATATTKFTRWQKIIQEAAEQCERSTAPKLSEPISFKNWVEQLNQYPSGLRIICTERQRVPHLENLLYNQRDVPATCAIAFGAEGGLTKEEIKLALAHEFVQASLGPLILRTETATIYTLAIVNAFLRLIQKDPQL